ncbi:uncharacterized protein LOC124879372 [Girardinichthys multiradiatus]|uniref:uncharacterized protein LOC124879372 n=1 Tax=Girardinichthys multiradiatus TaxID=208333 RepID=UPI001FAC7BE7|nr:uncharacterized protein LOC124879372 [Girardinichthys multiradiatus]
MHTTFALRFKEIISNDLPVAEILDRWPALKMESQFHRITNLNLKNHFFAVLDQHAPRLQSLFRKKAARTGKVSDVLSQLFRTYDLQEQVNIHVLRALVLHGLPSYLHEDTSTFIKTWDMTHSDEPDITEVPLGLLLIRASSTDATFFCPEKIAVLIEGNIIIDFTTLADAFVVGPLGNDLVSLVWTWPSHVPRGATRTHQELFDECPHRAWLQGGTLY